MHAAILCLCILCQASEDAVRASYGSISKTRVRESQRTPYSAFTVRYVLLIEGELTHTHPQVHSTT